MNLILTEGDRIELQFGKDGLIPAVIQEAATNDVVMLGFMNREALELTLATGKTHFWSRTRQELWLKGATSGQYLLVKEIFVNCEENSLLLKVELAGGVACHTGNRVCFYRAISLQHGDTENTEFLILTPDS